MSIYQYEEAFGAWDKTTRAMRKAIHSWFQLYYGIKGDGDTDPCQRIGYSVVNKLVRTIFGEYRVESDDGLTRKLLDELNTVARQAMELSLIGGECYLKPCPGKAGFSFTLIPRNHALIFGRNAAGEITDMGTVEQSIRGRYYYTLLERRTVDENGYLTIENKLFRSLNSQNLGNRVSLGEHPEYAGLADSYRYETPLNSVGVVRLKTPMLNCVDGSSDGVSVYAAAADLIARVDENEAQLREEFRRGQSRILASRDLLRDRGDGNLSLEDHLFVGLDEDPEQVGITIFSPQLRYQAYQERKQEYLRNLESIIGLKRGMLSDTNAEDRTATEISSSAGDYNLTVVDFQRVWEKMLAEGVQLCHSLAKIYQLGTPAETYTISVDWGNGILYDEDKTWEAYRKMVSDGLIKPEIALGWRFNMPAKTQADLAAIRSRLMPKRECVDL